MKKKAVEIGDLFLVYDKVFVCVEKLPSERPFAAFKCRCVAPGRRDVLLYANEYDVPCYGWNGYAWHCGLS